MSANPFQRATKQAARLRLALAGPAGSGKTYTALTLACALGKRVAVVDTERGSASKYADLFDFDVLTLEGSFHPKRYIDAIKGAEAAGYDVVVIDSLSHAWIGKDGGLDLHDQSVARQKTKNSFTAWADVTPHHMALVDALIQSGCHVIVTLRTKTEYVQDKDANGKPQVRKVGTSPLMRDGIEYEADVFGDMDAEHNLIITKTRCPALADKVFSRPGTDLARTLAAWLGTGPAPAPRPAAAPPATALAPAKPNHGDDVGKARAEYLGPLLRTLGKKWADLCDEVGAERGCKAGELTDSQFARACQILESQAREPAPEEAAPF